MENPVYIQLDSHSIGIKCLHCESPRLGNPLFTIGQPGSFSYLSLSCKSCHKETFVGFDIINEEASVSIRDSE